MSLVKSGVIAVVALIVATGCTAPTWRGTETHRRLVSGVDAQRPLDDMRDTSSRDRGAQQQDEQMRDRDRDRQDQQQQQLNNDRSNGVGGCPSCGRTETPPRTPSNPR